MALKKTSITISPAMMRDESKNGWQTKRSARIESVYERYHAIVDAAELPADLLTEKEGEFLSELLEQGLEHHPALPLSRAVGRRIEDLQLTGVEIIVDSHHLIDQLSTLTRAQEMALVEVMEFQLAQIRKAGVEPGASPALKH